MYKHILHALNVSSVVADPSNIASLTGANRIGLQHMRIRTRLGFYFIGITYVTTITAILAGCGAPFSKNWQIYPDPGSKFLLLEPLKVF